MGFFVSNQSRFLIDDTGGTPRDLSLYINELSGLPGDRLLRELTRLSDCGAVFLPSVENSRVSVRGLFDDTASSGPDEVLGHRGLTPRLLILSTGRKGRHRER